jgi:hypothetical protein
MPQGLDRVEARGARRRIPQPKKAPIRPENVTASAIDSGRISSGHPAAL